jgi:hypothetical protein
MKKLLPFASLLLAAGTILAADSPKDEVTSAAKMLMAADNYSWKSTVQTTGGGRFRPGPTEGKTEKNGVTMLTITRGENTNYGILENGKGVVKTDGNWESLSEAAKDDGNGFNPTRFFALMLQNYKTPAADAESLAEKTKDLTVAGGVYSGEMTEEGAKDRLTFGRRAGNGDGPTVSEAKGSVKFWIKDGTLSKYEFKVEGHVDFNGNERDVNRTTTVEIKDIGSTKVEVPEDARKKLS